MTISNNKKACVMIVGTSSGCSSCEIPEIVQLPQAVGSRDRDADVPIDVRRHGMEAFLEQVAVDDLVVVVVVVFRREHLLLLLVT